MTTRQITVHTPWGETYRGRKLGSTHTLTNQAGRSERVYAIDVSGKKRYARASWIRIGGEPQ
jgi:hypothetical protein